MIIFLLQNHAENKTGRLVPDLFFVFLLFFKKTLYKVKAIAQQHCLNIFWKTLTLQKANCKLYNILGY